MEFAMRWPCFMKDGEPLSWRHFVYGLTHIPRENARESLRLAGSVGALFGKEADRWFKIQETQAGWR